MHAATYSAFFDELNSISYEMEKDANLRQALAAGTKKVDNASIKAYIGLDNLLRKKTKGVLTADKVMGVSSAALDGPPVVNPAALFH